MGEEEERVVMGGGGGGPMVGVGELLRELLLDAREDNGEEDGKIGSLMGPDTVGEEVLGWRGMLGERYDPVILSVDARI